MTSRIFCTQGWAPALRRGMLALVVGASLGAGLLGVHVSSASASNPSHISHPTTQNTGATPSTGTGSQVSDQVGHVSSFCEAFYASHTQNGVSDNVGCIDPAGHVPGSSSQQPGNSTPTTCETLVAGSCGGTGTGTPPSSGSCNFGCTPPSTCETFVAGSCGGAPTTDNPCNHGNIDCGISNSNCGVLCPPSTGSAHCDAIGPNGPVCPQPGTGSCNNGVDGGLVYCGPGGCFGGGNCPPPSSGSCNFGCPPPSNGPCNGGSYPGNAGIVDCHPTCSFGDSNCLPPSNDQTCFGGDSNYCLPTGRPQLG